MNLDDRILRLEQEVAALRQRTGPGGLTFGPGLRISQSGSNVRIDLVPVTAAAASAASIVPAPPPRGIRYLKSRNGVLTWDTIDIPAPVAPRLVTLIIEMTNSVDDDVRVRIGGITVYDPKQTSAPKRTITLYVADLTERGVPTTSGTLVQVDTYDGQEVSYSTSTWTARQVFSDGNTYSTTGGSTNSDSSGAIPAYYPNGSFTLK